MTLPELIVKWNSPWEDLARGSIIHAIDATTAAKVAGLISTEARRQGLTDPYFAACVMQESRFDPDCWDQNGVKPPTFPTTDWGIAQESGSVLRATFPDSTDEQLQALATSADWAIPYMAGQMAAHLVKAAFVSLPSWVVEHTKQPVLWLATYMYNSGEYGAVADMNGPHKRQAHPDSVMKWYEQFKTDLGVTV